MAQLITGIFRDRTSAESAVDSLEEIVPISVEIPN